MARYWITAPTATGPVTRTCQATAPSAPIASTPPRQPIAAAGKERAEHSGDRGRGNRGPGDATDRGSDQISAGRTSRLSHSNDNGYH